MPDKTCKFVVKYHLSHATCIYLMVVDACAGLEFSPLLNVTTLSSEVPLDTLPNIEVSCIVIDL